MEDEQAQEQLADAAASDEQGEAVAEGAEQGAEDIPADSEQPEEHNAIPPGTSGSLHQSLGFEQEPGAEELGPTDIAELEAAGLQYEGGEMAEQEGLMDEQAEQIEGDMPMDGQDAQVDYAGDQMEGEMAMDGQDAQVDDAGGMDEQQHDANVDVDVDGNAHFGNGGDGGDAAYGDNNADYGQAYDDQAAYGVDGQGGDANAYANPDGDGGYDQNAYGYDGAAYGEQYGDQGQHAGGYDQHAGTYGNAASYADPPAYGDAGAGVDAAGAAGVGAGAAALSHAERSHHEAALKVEAKAREELEDMVLRIEKHFKAEQAARKKAEELLQASIASEMEAKQKVEEVMRKRAAEQRMLEDERAAIKRERQALESMRQDFEAELQAARSEVAKAQEALAASEERIRASEQLERARLEADYQTKLATMAAEVERMREELGYRTAMMSHEMEKWRQQAALTANAVLEAKNEVVERRKELDATKEKMDRLLDKLYIGRERGLELSGAIATNQRMMAFMPNSGLMKQPMQQVAMNATMPGTKLPPLKQQQLQQMAMQGHPPPGASPSYPFNNNSMVGGYDGNANGMIKAEASVRRVASGTALVDSGAPGHLDHGHNHTTRSEGHISPGQERTSKMAGSIPSYSHVQSKFAQDAHEKSMQAKAARRSGRIHTKAGKPDRFAEAEKEGTRLAAMGKRWS